MIKILMITVLMFVASEASHSHRGKHFAHFLVHSYEKLHHIKNEMEHTTEHTLEVR